LTTMSAAVLAAVLASVINAGIIKWPELVPRMVFSVTAAALLGGMIGAVIPKRYRGQITKRVKIALAEVDLKEVVQSCLDKFSERARKENVTIASTVAAEMPVLRLDLTKIRLAINGLLSNALEFTPAEGKIDIRVGLHSQGGIQLSVKDTGIGMPGYKVQAISNAPPEILHAAWKQVGEYENADLLQIRSIVEKHGGKFELKSHQWEGTEITVELPKELVCSKIPTIRSEAPIKAALGTVAA
jgi:two-component system sensor histidine kinase VicK